jgi:hypothetical protein
VASGSDVAVDEYHILLDRACGQHPAGGQLRLPGHRVIGVGKNDPIVDVEQGDLFIAIRS